MLRKLGHEKDYKAMVSSLRSCWISMKRLLLLVFSETRTVSTFPNTKIRAKISRKALELLLCSRKTVFRTVYFEENFKKNLLENCYHSLALSYPACVNFHLTLSKLD